MNIKEGQYLEFENKIAKINKKIGDNLKLRNFSYGNTKKGYSYQSSIKVKTLQKKIKEGKVKFISPEIIMQILLEKLKGGKRNGNLS